MKEPKDVTARSSQMKRNSALLYRNSSVNGDDPSHYRGMLKLENGDKFWLSLWVRLVRGQRALEIQLVPIKD